MVPRMIDLPRIVQAVSVDTIVNPVSVEAEIEVKIIVLMVISSSPLCDPGIASRIDEIIMTTKSEAIGIRGEGIENSFLVSFTYLS